MRFLFSFLLVFFVVFEASAEIYSHQATPTENTTALKKNAVFLRQNKNATRPRFKPVPDTADFKYVLLNSYTNSGEAKELRKTIARNLPADVKLVVLTAKQDATETFETFSRWISANRLIVAAHENPFVYNGFWARDSFPIPVIDKVSGDTSLVSMQYFRTFQSGEFIAQTLNADVTKHSSTFVGGNILADENGDCFSVKGPRLFGLNENALKSIFGCTEVHLLKHVAGIGDVDEVLKILPNKNALTTVDEYDSVLSDLGYSITKLPAPGGGEYRTYANSLIVGKQVFMPVYGTENDSVATKIYQKFGYEIYPVDSDTLSDKYLGSVHCQTMAYPEIDIAGVLKSMGAEVVYMN